VFATFKEARGLLEDDHEWRICLEKAIAMQLGNTNKIIDKKTTTSTTPAAPITKDYTLQPQRHKIETEMKIIEENIVY